MGGRQEVNFATRAVLAHWEHAGDQDTFFVLGPGSGFKLKTCCSRHTVHGAVCFFRFAGKFEEQVQGEKLKKDRESLFKKLGLSRDVEFRRS